MFDPLPILEQLININSVNPSLVSGAPGEKDIALFVKTWCESQGLKVQWLESQGRPSLIITAKGKGGGKSLMLNAHLDTVGVEGMPEAFSPRYEGKRLYGRGAVDMKAGLAACMVVIAQAQTLNLTGDVILTAVADEESDSIGMTQVLEHCHADAAIVTEPTQLNIHIAHRGFAVFEVEVLGLASHTSQPHLGANAISHMANILAEVQKVQEELQAKPPHPLLGHGVLQAVLIQGGSELFTTPAKSTLTLERRSLPGETQEILEQEIRELVSRVKSDKPFEVIFRTVLFRDAFETLEDAEIIQVLKKAVQRNRLDIRLEGAPFWMDSALIAAKGIPTVIFGPSGGGMHAVNEWVDIDSVPICAEVLLEVVKEFCG